MIKRTPTGLSDTHTQNICYSQNLRKEIIAKYYVEIDSAMAKTTF